MDPTGKQHETRIPCCIRKWYHKLEFYFQTSVFYFIYKAVFPCKPIGLILVGITEDKHLAVLWWLSVHHSSCIINNLLTFVKIGVSGEKKVSHVCLLIKWSHCLDTWVYWIELLVVNTFKILLVISIWPKTNDLCYKENTAFTFFHQSSPSPQTQAIPSTTALHLGDMRDNCRTLTVLINYGFPCSAALWSCRQFHDNW